MSTALRVPWPWALLLIAALPGCFETRAAAGQLALVNDQRPIAQAIDAEQDVERRGMLAAIAHVIAFGRDVMQLRPGDAYGGYYATESRGLTFVVIACEQTRFEPYTWWFPVAGTVAYKSHFDEASAEAEAQELRDQGYDAWVGYSRAYSTLGWFRDPIVTTMMRGGLLEFIEVILHELTHARLYVPGQTDFNEQLASFVARRGTEQLLAAHRHVQTGMLERFRDAVVRRGAFETQVDGAIAQLEQLYASGRPRAEILQQRQAVFDRLSQSLEGLAVKQGKDPRPERLVMNNARLLQWRRYGQSTAYLEQMWLRSGGSWPRFWQIVERYAIEELGELEEPSDSDGDDDTL